MKVVVAMSGGVDSSVAAGYLKSQGHEVIGISLQLHDMAEKVDNEFGTCCSLSDINDARRVAEKIDIPFYVTDMETEFNAGVIDDFIHEYLKGRTPNPCVRCNEKVKFHKLMDWAMDLGADYLATGHYANVRKNEATGEHELVKGADMAKDQSYFLFTMRQEELARTLFPVGGFTKPEVRDMARKLGLSIANKPDSQEICFVQAKSYADFIEEKVPASQLKPGPILYHTGEELGRHEGLHRYTIGQRKGLGVFKSEPLYVLGLDLAKNSLVVGPEAGLFRKWCTVSHTTWIAKVDLPLACHAKIRYRSKESPVELKPLPDGKIEVRFEVPQRAITPGQAMVFYSGDKVLGGGWIDDLPVTL